MNGSDYTAGAVTTQKKASWGPRSTRVCVSAKLPGGKGGKGIWPAHWLLPDDGSCWPKHGEIDIMEMVDGNSWLHGTYHWSDGADKCTGNHQSSMLHHMSGWDTDFHEYAAEWAADHVTFYVDGTAYWWVPHVPAPTWPAWPMYVLLNTAIGGAWPSPPDSSTEFPNYHVVDYVRVSQL
eukprot:Hpha_TRINITY_DN2892_c0_g1::TRINITY_DN2892_c0_g1_i1::g.171261::m.171261